MLTTNTAAVTHFSGACDWLGATSSERPAWLALRKGLITASDVACIMGEVPQRSPMAVYVEKRRELAANDEALSLDDPRFWGNVIEQPMLRAVAEYHGWEYFPGGALLRSKQYPFIGATLDAEINRGDGLWLDFEGKTTELMGEWDEETGKLPDRVLIQVQTQLLVSRAPLAIVFALLRRYKSVQIDVPPSPELQEVIIEHCEWFMDLLRRRTPPPVDATESCRMALNELHPAGDGTVVDLPGDALEWTRDINEINEQLRKLESQKAHLRNTIRAHIGPATYGALPEPVDGKSCWRWAGKDGGRTLLALKHTPNRLMKLPAPRVETIADQLERSLEHAQVIPIRKKRRKAKR